MTEKIIFDCDNTLGLPFKEVDDGLTLLYLLGVKGIELLGITTTFGNGRIDQVTMQTEKLVQRLGINLPVFQGESQTNLGAETAAAQFLVETVNKFPQQITLLVTGPLGNLAAAQKIDPEFFSKVRRILVMGGYLEPLKLGYRDLHELNFSANPQAAASVLSAACPVTVFPGQTCLDAPYTLRDIFKAKHWQFRMKLILSHWLFAFLIYFGIAKFYLWDLLPAVFLTHPHLFETRSFPLSLTPTDLQDGYLTESPRNPQTTIELATGIKNQPEFHQQLDNAWQTTTQHHRL